MTLRRRRVLKQDFRGKTATRDQYDAAFEKEYHAEYPTIDALEQRLGYAIDRGRLTAAARDLACPVKKSPPHWAHGRVLYAVARAYLRDNQPFDLPLTFLDIGTAKGFSATVMAWALAHWGGHGLPRIVSLDVTDPDARVPRNSVAEISGLKTVPEFVAPFWPDGVHVDFIGMSSLDWLQMTSQRIHFAFVDGKHDYAHVSQEAALIAESQEPGDVIVFDDIHYPGVAKAIKRLAGYSVQGMRVLEHRGYAIARKL